MTKLHKVEPRWVLVEGVLHEVSEFAGIPSNKRPKSICPVCQHPVTLKLGTKRVHHYAHKPEEICPATQPETALHLNTKFYLYHQLLQADKIYIEQHCSGYCTGKRQQIWIEGWDDVRVEYTMNSFRPDIALLSNGKVIGAIEVLVTHAVEDQKAEYFNDQNVPWLEIKATEEIYQGDTAWIPTAPLLFHRCSMKLPSWKCASCIAKKEQAQREKEFKKNNYKKIYAAKMVDFYFPSGKKYREVFYVMKQVKNGEWIEAWVETEKKKIIAREKAPITKESMARLKLAVQKYTNRKNAEIVDIRIEWRLWEEGQEFVARDTREYPFLYKWK